MDWIQKFDLFLFDFDGLLVNTEDLHFAAYQEMCRRRGFSLDWTLAQFFEAAHLSSTGIKEGIYRRFPELQAQEPQWEVLYAEKKQIYQELLSRGELALLPGVEKILQELEKLNKRRCVVTNSTAAQVNAIKEKIPLLKTIPHWFSRESYKEPKPHPECYEIAIQQLGYPKDRMIGFEDSLRGLKALRGAGVPVTLLICPSDHPQLKQKGLLEGFYFPSFEAIPVGFC